MDKRINNLYDIGVKLYICGKPATPEMVISYVLQDISNVMPEFFYDKEGRLNEVRF